MSDAADFLFSGSSKSITGEELKSGQSAADFLFRSRATNPATPAIRATINTNPDQAAQQQRLAEQLQVSPDVVPGVEQDLSTFAREREILSTLSDAPVTSGFFSDPNNAAVAHDDAELLAAQEQAIRRRTGFGAVRPGLVFDPAALEEAEQDAAKVAAVYQEYARFFPEAAAMSVRGLGELSRAGARSMMYRPAAAALETIGLGAVAKEIENIYAGMPWWLKPDDILIRGGNSLSQIGDFVGASEENKTIYSDISGGLGQLTAQITAAILTGGASSAVSLISMLGQGADIQAQMVEESGSAGTPEGDAAILLGAGITAGTERFGLENLLDRIPGLKNRVVRMLAGMTSEASQEVTEGVLQNLAAVALHSPELDVFEGVEREATVAGAVGLIAAAIIPGRQGLVGREFMDELHEINQNLKLNQRFPERADALTARMMAANSIPEYSISPVRVEEVLGSRAQQFFDQAGLTKAAIDARLTGGEVKMTHEQFSQMILRSEDYGVLAPHVRLGPDAMTEFEAKEFEASGIKKLVQEALKEPATETTETPEGTRAAPVEAKFDNPTHSLAEYELGLQAMFKTANEAGMTDAQYQSYLQARGEYVENVRKREEARRIKQEQRKLTDEWKAEEAKVRVKIEESVKNEPVYQAFLDVTEGELARDRLDRDAVSFLLGGDIQRLDALPKGPKGTRIYVAKGGIDPEILAEKYGFSSAGQMLDQMLRAPKFKDAVDQATAKEMARRNGEMLTRIEQLNQAYEDLTNSTTEAMLVEEMNALRAAEKAKRITPKLIRQAARDQLANMRVGDIDWRRFLRESARKGEEAGKALRAGDRQLAARLKFQQVIQFAMARETISLRDQLRKQYRQVAKYRGNIKHPTIDATYVDAIKGVLSTVNLAPRRNTTKLPDTFSRMQSQDGAILVPGLVNFETGQRNWREMTLRQWNTFHRQVLNLESQGRMAKQIVRGQEKADRKTLAAELAKQVEHRPDLGRVERERRQQDMGTFDKVRRYLTGLEAALVRIEFMLKELDNGKANGVWWQSFFKPAVDAQHQQNQIEAKYFAPILKALELLPTEIKADLSRQEYVPELNRKFTRANLLMMALNVGNESNYQKMIDGSHNDNDATPWTREGIEKALSKLTPQEWAWVQTVWDTYEALYPQVQEIYRKEFGVAPADVEARSFTVNGVKMRGGYFPVIYDRSRMKVKPDTKDPESALEAMQAPFVQATVYSGMTKERTEFSAPVALDLNGIARSGGQLAHYISHYEFVRNTRKLMKEDSVRKAINNKMGPEYLREFEKWLDIIARNGVEQSSESPEYDSIAAYLRSSVTAATLGFSYTTMMSQLLGYGQSVAVLGEDLETGRHSSYEGLKWVTTGIRKYLANPEAAVEHAMSLSKELPTRLSSIDRDIAHAIQLAKRNKHPIKEAGRFALQAIGAVQLYSVDMPTWVGAFNKAMAAGRSETQAADYADGVIRMSQGSGHLKDLSELQRRKGLWRVMTLFSTFTLTNYNLMRGVLRRGGKPVDVKSAATKMMWLVAIPAALDALLRAEAPDDDENPFVWWNAKALGYALMSIPTIGPAIIASAEGYTPTLSPVESAFRPMVRLADDTLDWDFDDGTAKALVGLVGRGLGVPGTVQLERMMKTLSEGDTSLYEYLIGPRKD